jgi:hypothetical protein
VTAPEEPEVRVAVVTGQHPFYDDPSFRAVVASGVRWCAGKL